MEGAKVPTTQPPPIPQKSASYVTTSKSTTSTISMSSMSLNSGQKPLEIQVRGKPMAQLSRVVYEWEWEIPNFSHAFIITHAKDKIPSIRSVRSLEMEIGKEINMKSNWQFHLWTKDGYLGWKMCLVKLHKTVIAPLFFNVTVSLVGERRQELLTAKTENMKASSVGDFGWDNFMDFEKLWAQRDVFLPDNKLRMEIVMELFKDQRKSTNVALKRKLSDFSVSMTMDMSKLRSNESTADVTLKCQGKLFPAHRLILSARSPAFASMFEKKLTEAYPNQLIIDDVEAMILEALLEFVYTGVLQVKYMENTKMLAGLIRAADAYKLNELKSFCFSAMLKAIHGENVGELAVLAFRHGAEPSIKKEIGSFCSGNLEELLKLKTFRTALKMEPDAFFADELEQ